MPRKPKCDPPEWRSPEASAESTLELNIRVITPMFGGGYEPGIVDVVNPIRAASIRGHLRFWWRAVAGGAFADPRSLYAAEAGLWGGAARRGKGGNLEIGPGKLVVRIKSSDIAAPACCGDYINRDPLAYALFPFKEPVADMLREFNFAVDINWSSDASLEEISEIRRAANAWILFGGVGARTRRGCGSIASSTAITWGITPGFTGEAPKVPSLSGAKYVLGRATSDSVHAWRTAVQVYRDFRQGTDRARNPGQGNRPGRSHWPEPDSIRRISGSAADNHQPTHKVVIGFPRADLGLPINFKFANERKGDPLLTTLGAAESDRMASPVITKSVYCGSGQFKPLVLVLNAPHVWVAGDLKLSGGANRRITEAQICLTDAERANVPPLAGEPVREALLDYAAKQWHANIMEIS